MYIKRHQKYSLTSAQYLKDSVQSRRHHIIEFFSCCPLPTTGSVPQIPKPMTDSQIPFEELSLASQASQGSPLDASQSRDDDDTFLCRIDKSHILQAFLQHLQFRKNQTTIVNVCVKTVRFVIEDSRVWQASLSLGDQIFSEFRASNTVQPFKVPLSVLLDCLNVYGPSSNSMLLMDYRGYGQPLKITFVFYAQRLTSFV